ncbi:hypothetical protein HDU76_008165, partial [Blyttiomyces sp. JEL0837]
MTDSNLLTTHTLDYMSLSAPESAHYSLQYSTHDSMQGISADHDGASGLPTPVGDSGLVPFHDANLGLDFDDEVSDVSSVDDSDDDYKDKIEDTKPKATKKSSPATTNFSRADTALKHTRIHVRKLLETGQPIPDTLDPKFLPTDDMLPPDGIKVRAPRAPRAKRTTKSTTNKNGDEKKTTTRRTRSSKVIVEDDDKDNEHGSREESAAVISTASATSPHEERDYDESARDDLPTPDRSLTSSRSRALSGSDGMDTTTSGDLQTIEALHSQYHPASIPTAAYSNAMSMGIMSPMHYFPAHYGAAQTGYATSIYPANFYGFSAAAAQQAGYFDGLANHYCSPAPTPARAAGAPIASPIWGSQKPSLSPNAGANDARDVQDSAITRLRTESGRSLYPPGSSASLSGYPSTDMKGLGSFESLYSTFEPTYSAYSTGMIPHSGWPTSSSPATHRYHPYRLSSTMYDMNTSAAAAASSIASVSSASRAGAHQSKSSDSPPSHIDHLLDSAMKTGTMHDNGLDSTPLRYPSSTVASSGSTGLASTLASPFNSIMYGVNSWGLPHPLTSRSSIDLPPLSSLNSSLASAQSPAHLDTSSSTAAKPKGDLKPPPLVTGRPSSSATVLFPTAVKSELSGANDDEEMPPPRGRTITKQQQERHHSSHSRHSQERRNQSTSGATATTKPKTTRSSLSKSANKNNNTGTDSSPTSTPSPTPSPPPPETPTFVVSPSTPLSASLTGMGLGMMGPVGMGPMGISGAVG